MEILMATDFIPSEGHTLVRKPSSDSQPKRKNGLLLPMDANSETIVRCEVVSSTLEFVEKGDFVVVLPTDLDTKVLLNNETFIILNNEKILGKVTGA